ncbi:MAG TPA: hypothetical protein VGX97_11405 [bacterium]|nr:hypothetical protein [bacterium]
MEEETMNSFRKAFGLVVAGVLVVGGASVFAPKATSALFVEHDRNAVIVEHDNRSALFVEHDRRAVIVEHDNRSALLVEHDHNNA